MVIFELVAAVVFGMSLAAIKARPYKNGLDALLALAASGLLLGSLTYLGWNN